MCDHDGTATGEVRVSGGYAHFTVVCERCRTVLARLESRVYRPDPKL